MKFATYSVAGEKFYGAVTKAGMISLNDAFPQWPTLFEAVRAGARALG